MGVGKLCLPLSDYLKRYLLSGLLTQRDIFFSGKEERLFMEGVYSYGTRPE